MKFKKVLNELYVLIIHFILLLVIPTLWIICMDEGSSFTRVIIPLILFGYSLAFSKSVARLVFEEQSHA